MLVETMKYLRFGECKRCGACCAQKNCIHLIFRDGIPICRVFHELPPECADYPMAPPIITESCGFRFVDKLHRKKLEARQAC